MKRSLPLVVILSLALTTTAMSLPGIVDLALQGFPPGSITELKQRISSLPITVFGAEDCRRAISLLPDSMRQSRITRGMLWQRVERVIKPVLELHHRSNKVELFLYHDPFPRALVWRGCILVLSDALADLLGEEELIGIVAHELAHAYFMDETVAAERQGDEQTLKIVELKCDAVAMLTLKLLRHNPAAYGIGLQRAADLRRRLGYPSVAPGTHPSMLERAQFAQRFIKLLRSTGTV